MAAEIGLFEAIVYGGGVVHTYHCPVVKMPDGQFRSLINGRPIEVKSSEPMCEYRRDMWKAKALEIVGAAETVSREAAATRW